MKKLLPKIVLAIILVILVWVGISTILNSLTTALSPLKQANQTLSTQMADLLHPTPTILPDPVTIIHDVRALSRLETIQYTVEKVITAEVSSQYFAWLNEDRLILVAHGTVIAGVDMEKLGPEDMQLENGVLKVRLPEPEIFMAALDNDKTYVYNRDTSVFRQADRNLETLARAAAEDEIEKAALNDGILETARINAENYLTRFFMALGYKDVIFIDEALTPEP